MSNRTSRRDPRGGTGPGTETDRTASSGIAARTIVALVVAAGTVAPTASLSAEPKDLSLQRAVQTAMSENDRVRSASANVQQQRASYRSSTANLGPRFRLESTVSRWDEPQTTEFSAPGQETGAEITVREQTTADLTLTVVQPLTPLWSLYEAQRLEKLGLEQAETNRRRTRRDVALEVVEAYFRLLQARAVRRVARQSLDRRERQRDRAEKFRKADQVPKNDVLRAKVGVARARQRLIEAKGQVELASAQLGRVMGRASDRRYTPTSDVELDYEPPADVDRAIERALRRRAALREADLRIDQARAGVRAARSKLLPQLNALATYRRSYGSTFANTESFFVGATLQWTFWQWGTDRFGIARARARRRQARIGRSRLRKGIALEVRNAYTKYETTRQSLKVARRAVASARENFRAEKKRYDAKLSTSIDLLDAETQLTETRTNARNAEYEHFIAAAKLRRALGLAPWPGTDPTAHSAEAP